jgi:UDP-4-amino-4,6-dideoxy-N-acetyl-beta-L-altrosamine transaminase
MQHDEQTIPRGGGARRPEAGGDPARAAAVGEMPARQQLLPYGRHSINADDEAAVLEVLRSDWLTTGPKVAEFETAFAAFVGAREAVAVSNGTAALHAAVDALGLGTGDEVLVPSITFAATANCVVFQGATPVFVDVDPATMLIDVAAVEAKLTPRTRAIIAVDYAGQPCEYEALGAIAERRGLALVADACHSLGATYRGKPVGTLARLSAFSFHPVKAMTTGEGGMVTTDDPALAARMRTFRNHGITTDHRQRAALGVSQYEMVHLGYNYRLSDLQCGLGLSQLRRVPAWIAERQRLAAAYEAAFDGDAVVRPLARQASASHAYHLFVVRLDLATIGCTRDEIFQRLRADGIGVSVHYPPAHLHPFYRRTFGTGPGLCPAAEAASERVLSLPIFPGMTDRDVDDVVRAVHRATGTGEPA